MECGKCQASNPAGSQFCNSCGAKLEERTPPQRWRSAGFVSYGWVRESPTSETRIELNDGVWHAVHLEKGEPDQHMIDLFGSHQLPTPWKEETDRETVVKEFAARNPHMHVK